MLELIQKPWPWYIAGPLIGLTIPLLLLLGNKPFGISSSLRHACSLILPKKNLPEYFKYDIKQNYWNLLFVVGVLAGGFFAGDLFGNPNPIALSESTQNYLVEVGIDQIGNEFIPSSLYNLQNGLGLVLLIIGGFLIGFGTRWADGCTSGHAIMGLSTMSLGSLIAVIGFFIGGLIVTWIIYPLILCK